MVEGPYDTRRLYHSRAARDDRAGAFPLQKVTSGKRSRFACSRRAASLRLGLVSGPYGPPLALAPVHPRCSRRLKRYLQAGWNRGTFYTPHP